MGLNNQLVEQAVVVSQDALAFNKSTKRLALFNEDGTPLSIFETSDPVSVSKFGTSSNITEVALQAAIDFVNSSGGGTVLIDKNVTLSATVNWKSNVTLEQKPGTYIDMSGVSYTGSYKAGIRAAGTFGSAVSLSADANKGLYQLTVSSATGLSVGDWVRISSTAQYPYSSGFLRGEVKQIRVISGTTLTFEQALYDTYLVSDSAVLAKVNYVTNIHAKGLDIRGSDTPATSERGLCIEVANYWSVVGCKFTNIDQYCLFLRSSIRGVVERNNFRGVYYDGTTGTIFYAIFVANASQWITVGHNNGDRVRHLITISGATNDPGQPRHITCPGNVAQNMEGGSGGRSWAYECHGIGEDIIFDGCIADGCYGGFVVRGPGVRVIGGAVHNWYAYALHVHPDIRDARDISFSNVTIGQRTTEGGGFSTPAAVRAELTDTTLVNNVVFENLLINFDVTTRPAIDIDGPTVTAINLITKSNVISHPGASVDSIRSLVKGSVVQGNIINGRLEGNTTLDELRTSEVSTLPIDALASSVGTITSGNLYGARAKCMKAGSYTGIRICTGTTAPVLTDFRGGCWADDGSVLGETANASATVNAASTVYSLNFIAPVVLAAGQQVFLGFGLIGGTVGTFRGVAGFSGTNAMVSGHRARSRSGWTTGPILTIVTVGSPILWADLF